MARRHHHYEQAVERFLRFHRVPYVSVNEARKTLLPGGLFAGHDSLKSFDFVLYGRPNLLAEIKGRRIPASGRLDPWATRHDVDDLLAWESLFGPGFRACLLFAFWCDAPPRSRLAFEDIFEHDGRWYALRAIAAGDFAAHMTTRSDRWDTVHIPTTVFAALSRDLLAPPEAQPEARPEARSEAQREARLARRPEPRPLAGGTFGSALRRFGVPLAIG